MTVSKISLSGLTFSVYVNFLWNKYNSLPAQTSSYRRLLAHLTLLPLPVAYALMSYNLQFALSIMWLDGVILLPLLLLGVEKLLDNPRLLKTPIVRNGRQATVGYCPEVWQGWA